MTSRENDLYDTDSQHYSFPVRGEGWSGLTVTDSGKVLVLSYDVVSVYEADGQFVREFGKDILKNARDITAANDGRVMVVDSDDCCVQIFTEHGKYLNKFKLQECYSRLLFKNCQIAFHRASDHVVFAGSTRETPLQVKIYTKDGEFVRSTQINDERIQYLPGMTVTTEGRIVVLLGCIHGNYDVAGWVLVL